MDWRRFMNVNYWAVGLAILMAGLLIYRQLTLRAFWVDEAAVGLMAQRPWSGMFTAIIMDNQPWPHAVIVKLWAGVLEASELSLRSISGLFVLLIVYTMYRFGRDILQMKRAGWLAAWATATSPFLLWFGSQARGYTMAVWLGLLSWYWFMRLLRQPSNRTGWWYIGVTAVALYLHPWMAFVVASQVAVFLVARGLGLIPWRRGWWLVGLGSVSLPWIGLMIYQARLGISSWINPVGLSALRESLGYLVFRMGWVYLLPTLVVVAIWLHRWHEDGLPAWSKLKVFLSCSLAIALIGPLIMAWLVSLVRPLYVPGRYDVIVLPYLLLLLAYIWSSVRWRPWWLVIVAVLVVGGWQAAEQERASAKELVSNDATVVQHILEQAGRGDFIVTSDLSYATVQYYSTEHMAENSDIQLLAFPPEVVAHPGWLDRPSWLASDEKVKTAASSISEQIAQANPSRVWLFYKQGVFGDALLQSLRQSWTIDQVYAPPQPRENSWFDGVVVLKRD